MTFGALVQQAQARHLSVLGGFHPGPADSDLPKGCQTVLMLGPDEPRFWPAFQQSAEWRDGMADPMDRWSTRVIGAWADDLGATAVYPFGGPPFKPFYSWALRTGRIHSSPVQLLVHDQAGLFVSFRGALALSEHIDLPPPPPNPCTACTDRPCLSSCLGDALTGQGYDVPRCKAFLDTPRGTENMQLGCNVRRSCPISQDFGRMPDQSAYHMRQFKGV